jgi:hypothetical protein
LNPIRNHPKGDCSAHYWGIVVLLLFAMPAFGKADVPPPLAAEFREPDGLDDPMRTLTLTVYLLMAVTVGSVSLMLVLMLWGSRVRREARKPLPAIKRNDPLWYLKAKRKVPGEPDVSDEQEPPETRPDDPPLS